MNTDFLRVDQRASFMRQASVIDLINELQSGDRELVIVAGAGISVDSGLPVWDALLNAIAKDVFDESQLKSLRALGDMSVERKAGLISQEYEKKYRHRNIEDMLMDGLRLIPHPSPGELALAIVRLALAYRGRTSIITTNFDWVLEEAFEGAVSKNTKLGGEVHSFSHDKWNEWRELDNESSRLSVMHIHGMLGRTTKDGQRDKAKWPLVIREEDFLRQGGDIRDSMESFLEGALVLFVGSGLADIDIIAPLQKTKSKEGKRFTIITPRLTCEGLNEDECIEYTETYANYMETSLDVKPMLTRTYGQAAQLVSEAALATRVQKQYGDSTELQSIHYDRRLERALQRAYKAIGANPMTGDLDDLEAISTGARFYKACNGAGGPISLLESYRLGLSAKDKPSEEHFGVFLWLDDLPSREGCVQGLRLVTTSSYVHWESWSSFRVDRVYSNSRSAAVRAFFEAKITMLNIPGNTRDRLSWRGAYAIPLIAASTESNEMVLDAEPLDQLIMGAISVNSTAPVALEEGHPSEPLSILAQMTNGQMYRFHNALSEAVNYLMK